MDPLTPHHMFGIAPAAHVYDIVHPQLLEPLRQLAHEVARRRLGHSAIPADVIAQVAAGGKFQHNIDAVSLLEET